MRKKGLLNILLQTSRLHSSCKSSNRFTDRSRTRESFSRFFQKNPFLLDHRSISPSSPLEPEGNELFREWLPSHVYIFPRYEQQPRILVPEDKRGRGLVGRWMITPSYYLDAVELLCGETRGETRQRDVLGFLPIRITAAIVRPPEDIAEGTRKLLEDRHFRSAHRFVPVIMSSHRFRGWSILPLLPPPLPPLA